MVKWVESRCYEEERHSQDVQHLSQKEERCRLSSSRSPLSKGRAPWSSAAPWSTGRGPRYKRT